MHTQTPVNNALVVVNEPRISSLIKSMTPLVNETLTMTNGIPTRPCQLYARILVAMNIRVVRIRGVEFWCLPSACCVRQKIIKECAYMCTYKYIYIIHNKNHHEQQVLLGKKARTCVFVREMLKREELKRISLNYCTYIYYSRMRRM